MAQLGESWSPQNHSYPEKMFPSNVLISLEAEKNPLSFIENPHKSPFRNFFYDHSKVELFSFLCSNFYKKILSITRQRKDATAVAQLTLFWTLAFLTINVIRIISLTLSGIASQSRFWNLSAVQFVLQIDIERYSLHNTSLIVTLTVASSLLCFCMFVARKNQRLVCSILLMFWN